MLTPMKAPTHVRRFILLTAALVLSACSAENSTAPTSQVSAKSTPSMFVPTAAAKALIGAKVGDTVKWRRPAGDLDLEIAEIRY